MWPLAEDTISREEIHSLADWLHGGPRLTQGEQVRRFEAAWSAWLGVEESVMVSSGTGANFALMAAVQPRVKQWPPRVGVAAVTWATNLTPSILLRHRLVVFDVERETMGINREQACQAMEDGELDILFVTHLLGFNALDERVVETAGRCGVILLEDCCEAHGARLGKDRVGAIGMASTFSFYFGHHISTIEGGMIGTSDAELADDLRLTRAHGLARESRRFTEYAEANPGVDRRFLFVKPGLNFRSTELNAVLGQSQLKTLDPRIEHRNRNMKRFLADAPEWLWTDFRTDGMSSFALPLIARDRTAAAWVRRAVEDLGIESRPIVGGNLLKQPFLDLERVTVAGEGTPVADHLHDLGLYVGNGHHVDESMVSALTTRLHEVAASG